MSEVWVLTSTGSSHGQGASEPTTVLARVDPYVPEFHPAFPTLECAMDYLDTLDPIWRTFYTPLRLEVRP